MGTPSNIQDPLWYSDIGATHHITHDRSVFSNKNAYTGNDFVQLSNGSSMSIRDFGSTFLSITHSSHSFKLHNLLHVPSVNKNLLSVSQFSRDNGVFFEFFVDHCFVKNQDTKEIILQGKIHDDLYVFPHLQQALQPSVNTASSNNVVNNYDIWHKCLGHVSLELFIMLCAYKMFHIIIMLISVIHVLRLNLINYLFHLLLTLYIAPLQLIFVNIWGPSYTPSTNGSL